MKSLHLYSAFLFFSKHSKRSNIVRGYLLIHQNVWLTKKYCQVSSIKGVIGCKIHFYMLYEHKCVLAVFVHIHPLMIKIHPVLFLIPINNIPFLKSSHSQLLRCVTSHNPGPSHDYWLTLVFTLDPPWVSCNSPPLFRRLSRMSPKRLRCLLLDVIMNIAVLIYSRYLSRWRCSGLHLFLKGMRPPIYLNASVVRIIRDPASPPEEVSIRFFYESL